MYAGKIIRSLFTACLEQKELTPSTPSVSSRALGETELPTSQKMRHEIIVFLH